MKGNIGRIEMRAPEMPSIMLLAGVAGAPPDGGMRRTLVVCICMYLRHLLLLC
jgi:hypothetical protein